MLSECSGFGTEICEIQFNVRIRESFRGEVVFELNLTNGNICGDDNWSTRGRYSGSGSNGYSGPSPEYSK